MKNVVKQMILLLTVMRLIYNWLQYQYFLQDAVILQIMRTRLKMILTLNRAVEMNIYSLQHYLSDRGGDTFYIIDTETFISSYTLNESLIHLSISSCKIKFIIEVIDVRNYM